MTNALTIPEADESQVRRECMEWAVALNSMRDTPKEDTADVIDDAALIEHYITEGQSVAVYCADGVRWVFSCQRD